MSEVILGVDPNAKRATVRREPKLKELLDGQRPFRPVREAHPVVGDKALPDMPTGSSSSSFPCHSGEAASANQPAHTGWLRSLRSLVGG